MKGVIMRNWFGRCLMLLALVLGFAAIQTPVFADSISSTITAVSGYQTSAVAVGIAVLLFVLGRKVVRKMI